MYDLTLICIIDSPPLFGVQSIDLLMFILKGMGKLAMHLYLKSSPRCGRSFHQVQRACGCPSLLAVWNESRPMMFFSGTI